MQVRVLPGAPFNMKKVRVYFNDYSVTWYLPDEETSNFIFRIRAQGVWATTDDCKLFILPQATTDIQIEDDESLS